MSTVKELADGVRKMNNCSSFYFADIKNVVTGNIKAAAYTLYTVLVV